MKIDTKKTENVTNRLTSVFGVVLGVFLSRLIVTLTPDKQSTVVNWLIGLGSTGLMALIGGEGHFYSLTSGALLGMAGNTVVTGSQALMQSNNMVAVPTSAEGLTLSKKLMLATAGFPVNSIAASLSSGETAVKNALRGETPVYDASLWNKYKEVAQRVQPKEELAGYAVNRTAIAGY